ncbi:MAG: type II toxin-antitoxin system HicB family antitoxin [Victivallales bacterium]|nr:type II toxin-antitoxin system HicB family antitoxin [Victivallales bacterium]
MSIITYKGYSAKIEYSPEDNIIFGKILFINDRILFDAINCDEIEQSFHDAVDGYLEDCKELNVPPDKPFSGNFNVRITPELHKQLAQTVAQEDYKNQNQFIKEAIEEKINNKNVIAHKHEHIHKKEYNINIEQSEQEPLDYPPKNLPFDVHKQKNMINHKVN